jgi:hypothetical protein
MRSVVCLFALATIAVAAPADDFIAAATKEHGDAGGVAARFLVENMPEQDKQNVSAVDLERNLDLAFKARAEFSWAKVVPEEIFLNDVLPYAVLDEPRDPWRQEFHDKAADIVKDTKSITEAAQALNREFFKVVKVHYNTNRKRPNQSPKESIESGTATCSGLSIILVDACRSVGIPARAVGTPMWSNGLGNHTWVEIWDGGWHFTGADEYEKDGLDRGWFVNDAAKARADVPVNAIYATSWKRGGLIFPMVWAEGSEAVAGINVTDRYAKPRANPSEAADLGVRLFEKRGGGRLAASVAVVDEHGKILGNSETKAGVADLNDMPHFELLPGAKGTLRFTHGGERKETAFGPVEKGSQTLDVFWDD